MMTETNFYNTILHVATQKSFEFDYCNSGQVFQCLQIQVQVGQGGGWQWSRPALARLSKNTQIQKHKSTER